MIGIIFLDDNYKEVKLPNSETVTKEEFKDFIHKVYYIYFNCLERMQWFQSTFKQYDEMNSIFVKKNTGAYEYDEDADYWIHLKRLSDEEKASKIRDAYMNRVKDEV